MKKRKIEQAQNVLSKLSGIEINKLTVVKHQDHGDYVPLAKVFDREGNVGRAESRENLANLVKNTAPRVYKKKIKTAGSSVSGCILMVSSAIALPIVQSHSNQWMDLIWIVPAVLAYPVFYFFGRSRRQPIDVFTHEFLANSDKFGVTPEDLEVLNQIIEQKLVIFGKDIDGKFWRYSPGILKVENWQLFLLFGVEAKTVLFLEGTFPSKGLYVLKSDALKLQKGLGFDAGFEAERPEVSSKLAKNSRFSPNLKCILWKKHIAESFLKKAASAIDLKQPRARWRDGIEYICEHWPQSRHYQIGKLSGDALDNFKNGLLAVLRDPKKSDEENLKDTKDFLQGKTRYFDDWVKSWGIASDEEIAKVTTDYLRNKKGSK